jgi:tRNA pseudouridine55 synthase
VYSSFGERTLNFKSISRDIAPLTMPKVSLPPLPLSGLFALVKPSGRTSMSVINDLKNLLSSSRLFAEEGKAKANSNSGKRGKRNRDAVKMGQGGTLDPLADGVLGD